MSLISSRTEQSFGFLATKTTKNEYHLFRDGLIAVETPNRMVRRFWLEVGDTFRLTADRATPLPFAARKIQPVHDRPTAPIHSIGRQRVMLDSDLARLYGVPTSRLNEAVKRNIDRFPADFRFQLAREEYANLISQFAISSSDGANLQSNRPNASQSVMGSGYGGLRKIPWAFTEHGALMAATVLKSPRAVQMSLFVVRAFVQMREELLAHATVFKRLVEIDKKLVTHDVILRDVYEKLRPLLNPPVVPRREIGFHANIKKPRA